MTDTIFALATPPGVSGVAVVRVSGPKTREILGRLIGKAKSPAERQAELRRLCHPETGNLIDQGLILWFPGPRSFTGEDVVELHLHGGPAILAEIQSTLRVLGCRPAEAGEFSRRALDNNKLDLVSVEALDLMIQAQDPARLQMAQGQASRERQALFDSWRHILIRLQAACEALIDFPEDDLPDELVNQNREDLDDLTAQVRALEQRSDLAQQLDQGLEILLVGPPNAGKSTLLNALAGYERAIVTAQPGTTRDFVELDMRLGRFQVRFVDTAGLRETEDEIEKLGVERTQSRFETAALIMSLSDPSQHFEILDTETPVWEIRTKGLVPGSRSIAAGNKGQPGIERLLKDLEEWLDQTYGLVTEGLSFHRERQVFHVKQLGNALSEAQRNHILPELQGEHLRQAADALAHLSGRIHVEDVLDSLFSGFCIGK